MQCGRPRLDPWVGKFPWWREWQPVLLPWKFHGQRSLAGYIQFMGSQRTDMTEQLTLSLSVSLYKLTMCQEVFLHMLHVEHIYAIQPSNSTPRYLTKRKNAHGKACTWGFIVTFFILALWSEVTQLCPTLCDPMDCSLPGSSVHGIFQAIYWSGLPFPSPGDLPNPRIEPGSLAM